jgi:SET domain-containing protein
MHTTPAVLPSPTIEVRLSPGRGRGVFATAVIRQGDVFDRAYALVIPDDQWEHIERSLLVNYCYSWGDLGALALGAGSLYNHSYTPNARYIKRMDELVIEYLALRDIAPGEEITINYNGTTDDGAPVWFDVVP